MVYRIIITDMAEEQLNLLVNYILFKFNNEPAAKHLLDGVEKLYERMEEQQ